jgi:hypothetical protein
MRQRTSRFVPKPAGTKTQPIITNAQSQGERREPAGRNSPTLGAIVFTLTVNVVAWAAVKAWVAGRSQVAAGGAPAQLSDAVPLIPADPIESE